ARAKGLSARQAAWRHALPTVWAPIVTIIGLQFGFLLAGAIIIETVFSLPGLGRLLFQAVSQRDIPVVEGVVLLVVGAVVVANGVCDLLAIASDPRQSARRPASASP
ncbi:MAG: ABC transporter permease subunit, partial [Pseudomonadota bacterium]